MAKQVLSDHDFNNVARIVNLPDPTAPQHAATKAYVDAGREGLNFKDDVVVDSTSNVNLAAPGATVNGIAMSAGQTFLARGQTAPAENGTYVWNGAASAATRAPDMNVSAEFNVAIVAVKAGPNAGTAWRQTAIDPTVGTTAIAFAPFGTGAAAASETIAGTLEIATQAEVDAGTDDARAVTPAKLGAHAGRKFKNATNVGDGSATQYDITHNFNTRDTHVGVYRNASPWDEILCDVERPDANTTRVRFASAPTSNQFRVVTIA